MVNGRAWFSNAIVCHMRRCSGFSTTELAAALVIVCGISLFMYPKLKENEQRGLASSCASNERMLGLAMDQYTQDNDSRYPINEFMAGPQGKQRIDHNWAQAIFPYTSGSDVFKCPANPSRTTVLMSGLGPVPHSQLPRSYTVAYELFDPHFYAPHTRSFVIRPSTRIMLSEASAGDNELGMGWDDWNSHGNRHMWENTGFCGHNGRWNCLFCDGHIECLTPTETAEPKSMWGALNHGDQPTCGPRFYSYNCSDGSISGSQALSDLEDKYTQSQDAAQ